MQRGGANRRPLEAKGWRLAKAAEHLAETEALARFNISQATLSRKTPPGSKVPIEPEVAAAVEGLETRVGYERQTEIVTKDLLALHGDPPIVDGSDLCPPLRKKPRFREVAEPGGFLLRVHRLEVMQWVMQISRPDRSGEAYERVGGRRGLWTLLRKRGRRPSALPARAWAPLAGTGIQAR